jgi:hypothetical protein
MGYAERQGRLRMPSPFPGLNPYFEQTNYWLDFHNGEPEPRLTADDAIWARQFVSAVA